MIEITDEIVQMASNLAKIYGQDYNTLSDSEKRSYIRCVIALNHTANKS